MRNLCSNPSQMLLSGEDGRACSFGTATASVILWSWRSRKGASSIKASYGVSSRCRRLLTPAPGSGAALTKRITNQSVRARGARPQAIAAANRTTTLTRAGMLPAG